jgi:2-polyprenyl-6-methoxyphenol hydroxylase-like FAD-dependent oxidoreductase
MPELKTDRDLTLAVEVGSAESDVDRLAAQARDSSGLDGYLAGHALVIGGSMAGLLAARVLADHFARVTIVERDCFPVGPAYRPGVPQSRHVHGLLARGERLLEGWFPGLTDELTEAGAQTLAAPTDLLWLVDAGWVRRFPSSVTGVTMSRHLLEWAIRRRVAALRGVRFVEAAEAIGLLADPNGDAVRGIRFRRRGEPGGSRPDLSQEAEEELEADLVVDASGRDSKAPRWLEALGYEAPKETQVNAYLGYATRFYRPPESHKADWRGLMIGAVAPDLPRGGMLMPVEGNQWIVGLSGYGRDYPPTDEAGFLEYARSLRSRVIYDAIKDAEPLTPIHGYQRTSNQLRHFDRLDRWPERFVVTGDAVCAFNPVYGQGMTVAALDAATLDACLRQQRGRTRAANPSGLALAVQKQLGETVKGPWLIATGADLRFPTTEGGRTGLSSRLIQRYIDRVVAVTTEDPAVFEAFFEVVNMLAKPTALFRPSILRRVLDGLREPSLVEPPTADMLTTSGERVAARIARAA